MFNITKENAEVFWNELEARTNDLEKQIEKLEAKVAEEVKKSPYAGSFEIQWQCSAIAGRNAVFVLRALIEQARHSIEAVNRNGDLIMIALIQGLFNRALKSSSTSTFHAANLVEEMELSNIREILLETIQYSIKEQKTEPQPA